MCKATRYKDVKNYQWLTLDYSVDSETEKQIMDIVEAEFGEATVIMVTHRLSGIGRFDRVAVLNAGVLAEFGSPEELLRDGESALSRLCEAQGRGSDAGSGSE